MANVLSPRAAFSGLDDAAWLTILKRSLDAHTIDGVRLPGFPPDEMQIRTVGQANDAALDEAFNFYVFVKGACERYGVELAPASRILDFGIGWGRIARFFLKDIEPDGLFGVDVDAELISVSRATGVPATIAHVDPRGSMPYHDAMFKLVTAYSVFTHLPEPIQDTWLTEIGRTLAPGGLFVATVLPPRALELVATIDPEDPAAHFGHRRMAQRLRRVPEAPAILAERGFSYLPSRSATWDDPNETFGNAFLSPAYARRHWGTFFDVLDYYDGPDFAQAIIVARAR
jgi:SAM-dependent methyltransferase